MILEIGQEAVVENCKYFHFNLQGFVPGMFGVSHGALQFMTYEEMKNKYNEYRNVPINTKLVSPWIQYIVAAIQAIV